MKLNTHIRINSTPTEDELFVAACLWPQDYAGTLGHLRWHQSTPYARVVVALHGELVVACGTSVHFGSSGRIARIYVDMHQRRQGAGTAVALHLIEMMEAEGLSTQTVQAQGEEETAFWEALGFSPEHHFVRYADGNFLQAQRDEVILMEPTHTLALLHLDKQATGEDRSRLLLEHRYVAQAYLEEGRVRGGLLPILGHGLILADSPAVGLELQRWLLPTQAHIVIPEANATACAHLQERGYKVLAKSTRMVRGPRPHFRPELVYAWPW